ncbi:MAG: histidinol dehydrogenase [Gemmatimonadaceae bacterium]
MTIANRIGSDARTEDGRALSLRFRGAVAALSDLDRQQLFDRATRRDESLRGRVADIIEFVRREGDTALVELARDFDHVELRQLEVPRAELLQARDQLDPALCRALLRAADNIARVHRAFLPQASEISPEPGVRVGRRPDPLGRVGVYAPGGRAIYPSSVLMGAVPARVAGVGEIILCTPPDVSGRPNDLLLAAAAIAGVDRVFAVGGAGAIAALALGTATIPRVDRIVGPGNAYVTEAKLQVVGLVGIDAPAGPSEILVIADESSNADIVARELLAQAEHDPLACVVAIVVGSDTAHAVERALASQLAGVVRRDIVEAALDGQGGVLTVDSLDEAVTTANRYAAEHVLVALPSTEQCEKVARQLRNAGTVFIGETSSNAFGDYITGANHVLPTLGLARSYSGLSVLDFFRWTTYQEIDRVAAARLGADVALIAAAEKLPGHASAARAWLENTEPTEPAAARSLSHPLFVRPEVAALSRYSEAAEQFDAALAKDSAIVDLSDNTNLWGTAPAALDALHDSGDGVSRYPAPYSAELKRALKRYVGVRDAEIVVGCGSDDILDTAMRTFGGSYKHIAYSTPTFSMIPFLARLNGLSPIEIPLRDSKDGVDMDAQQLVDTGAQLIYICSPNNPTATTVSRDALRFVVEHATGVVILDEAYTEFAATTNADLIATHDRLLVTRTMSKAFGLAGARVGYGIGAAQLVDYVERARGPYKVTSLAERAALAALSDTHDGLGWMREHARLARENRTRFVRALDALGIDSLPSETNFVLLAHPRAKEIADRLWSEGVIVRALYNLPQQLRVLAGSGGNALRIGVGPWRAMERVLRVLEDATSS